MIRPAAFLLLAALAAAPAAAESIYIEDTPDWTASSTTDYELVDETDRIVMARAVARPGGEARFRIEERLKGDSGKAAFLDTQYGAAKGSLHLFFMNESDGEWLLSSAGIVEVEAGNRDWVRAIRLFARISALDDAEAEKRALRDLREAALANPGRYPKALVRMIDLHFGTPSPGKPFSDLVDMYDQAPTDGERLAVLRALRDGDHPETPAFFRGLLLGGEPLWLMQPVLEWMKEDADEADVPLLKSLARVWLGHPGEDRGLLLKLMIQIAKPEDSPLLWSLMPAADMWEKHSLVEHILGGNEPSPFADKLRLSPDDPVTDDMFVLCLIADTEAQERLQALLRKNDTRDWGTVASLEELLSAWEASREPAERREVLMEVARRFEKRAWGEGEDLRVLWRLLRQASAQETEAVLEVAYSHLLADEEDLVALYRTASGEEERNRVLWLFLAHHYGYRGLEPLLSAAGALGRGPLRLERVARAFLTCPLAEVRINLAFDLEEELALPGDFLTMLEILEGADLLEARALAPWFARHPGPEALPLLWRVPFDSLYVEPELTEALAASGDPEVLDMALDLRRRVATEDYRWPFRVIAWSPLPDAEEEARSILQDDGFPSFQLMRELGSEGNQSPWRERFLQEIAEIETLDEGLRKNALTYLARLSSSGASPEP